MHKKVATHIAPVQEGMVFLGYNGHVAEHGKPALTTYDTTK
jgi:hypothetical protein